jgi:5-methylcytosine-specific restriction endonuclease McrA
MVSSLCDAELICGFTSLSAQEFSRTSALLEHIAEIDARHLYLQEGFESMRDYCMAMLRLSEQAAYQRVQVARLGLQFPALFPALADGRLHMASVRTLSAHLNEANVEELITEAANRTVTEVEVLLARRFPQAEPLRLDDGIVPQIVTRDPLASRRVEFQKVPHVRTKVAPIAPERYSLQVMISGATREKLRRAQELLGHAVPGGNVEQVLERALDTLIVQLEKRKFGTTDQPRKPRPGGTRRAIPGQIRRLVYQRDAGRCAALKQDGERCGSTTRLEFDHIVPVARGGRSTVENLRLVCRAHNRFAAEQAFGREFMEAKQRP